MASESEQGQLRLVLPSTSATAVDRLVRAVDRVARADGSLRLVDAVEHVVPLTADRFPLSEASFDKYRTGWRRFVGFAEAHRCLLVSSVDRDLCLAWITAPSVVDEYPVPPTAETSCCRVQHFLAVDRRR